MIHASCYLVVALSVLTIQAQAQWPATVIAPGIQAGAAVEVDSGDINGDGVPDILFADPYSSGIGWYETTANATVFVYHQVSTAASVHVARLMDVDMDGDLDILYSAGYTTEWLENNGAGSGWTPHTIHASSEAIGFTNRIAIADLDGDGDDDMVAMIQSPGSGNLNMAFYQNDGSNLSIHQIIHLLNVTSTLVLADLDGDGDLDIPNMDLSFPSGPWLRNHSAPGNVSFGYYGSMPPTKNAVPMDLDHDGRVDILQFTHVMSWTRNLGGGNFASPMALNAPHPVPGNRFYYEGKAADMDGDGLEDLLIQMRPTNTTSAGTKTRTALFRNQGNGTLGPRIDLSTSNGERVRLGFTLNDFDQDGDLDAVDAQRNASDFIGDLLLHHNNTTLDQAVPSLCFPVANSTGLPGGLTVTGSDHVMTNGTVLNASDLPVGAFGYFVVATASTNGFTPPGSVGPLCLGGAIGRFNQPSEVRRADGQGRFSLAIDLLAVPTPMGPAAMTAGETRVFQAWHRDSAANSSNFTIARQVTFQ